MHLLMHLMLQGLQVGLGMQMSALWQDAVLQQIHLNDRAGHAYSWNLKRSKVLIWRLCLADNCTPTTSNPDAYTPMSTRVMPQVIEGIVTR